jgi:hypothetical protein
VQETPPDLTYREEELLQLYEDLLALPEDEAKVTADSSARVSTEERDREVVEVIVSRLSPSAPEQPDAFSALLYQRVAQAPHIPVQPHSHETARLPHHVALNLLTPIIQELTTIHGPSSAGVPLSLLSMDEWRSLTRVCVRTSFATCTLTLKERHPSSLTMIPTLLKLLLNS